MVMFRNKFWCLFMCALINWWSLLCTCKNGKQGGHKERAAEVKKTTEEEEWGTYIRKKNFSFSIYLTKKVTYFYACIQFCNTFDVLTSNSLLHIFDHTHSRHIKLGLLNKVVPIVIFVFFVAVKILRKDPQLAAALVKTFCRMTGDWKHFYTDYIALVCHISSRAKIQCTHKPFRNFLLLSFT